MFWERLYTWKRNKTRVETRTFMVAKSRCAAVTCTELVMVLRANTVAQSLMVDWLSNAP